MDDFNEWIKDGYGSATELTEHFELGLEMLFYVEEDTFSRREIQQVASMLVSLRQYLLKKEK